MDPSLNSGWQTAGTAQVAGLASAVNCLRMASLDQLGFNFRPPERRIWTVRDLIASVRIQMERAYTDVWLEGEISNFRAHGSCHLYFSLTHETAQIVVAMFRSDSP